MPPTIEGKAHRLFGAGAVREVTPARVFHVEGDHGNYHVSVSKAGAFCTCPNQEECSHMQAVALFMMDEAR